MDPKAPDERSVLEDLAFGHPSSFIETSSKWVIQVCCPSLDGYGASLASIIQSTEYKDMEAIISQLPEFKKDREAREAYFQELVGFQATKNRKVRTGFKPGAARYATAIQQRYEGRLGRMHTKGFVRRGIQEADIGLAEGDEREMECQRQEFLGSMERLRCSLCAALQRGEQEKILEILVLMERMQTEWGFDLCGNLPRK
ncbi:hypothetical protein B9Z65_9028 [Elsinoe australis]|uniref:Uncharacterized protein n=1 Tax=Elsinoe australis TaxID=40998 RepID=A0A2P8ABJ4_9PEZI|nr:hypothetical protein B9Z65_9028 [Elsinoe australis]